MLYAPQGAGIWCSMLTFLTTFMLKRRLQSKVRRMRGHLVRHLANAGTCPPGRPSACLTFRFSCPGLTQASCRWLPCWLREDRARVGGVRPGNQPRTPPTHSDTRGVTSLLPWWLRPPLLPRSPQHRPQGWTLPLSSPGYSVSLWPRWASIPRASGPRLCAQQVLSESLLDKRLVSS